MPKKTLVIIPTYNESLNITRLIDSILAEETGDFKFDVLVVDDSSPDGTADLVTKHPQLGQKVWLAVRKVKDGRGGAVLEGFRYALNKEGYDFVIEMDSDFSHDPKELISLVKAGSSNDLTVASRYQPGSKILGWGIKRKLFSAMANFYARSVLRIPLSDYTNGYRCYKLGLLRKLDFSKVHAKGYIVMSELAYQFYLRGAKIGTIPSIFVNRTRGGSNLDLAEISEAFFAVPKIYCKYRNERRQQCLR
ncbi:MAG: polyprenol monophosphomannose synthase [Deltaproteobacteria bacterium]|nr:polyprenol monophosphomannose synthase [Deltaproteobacteria bacterium]